MTKFSLPNNGLQPNVGGDGSVRHCCRIVLPNFLKKTHAPIASNPTRPSAPTVNIQAIAVQAIDLG